MSPPAQSPRPPSPVITTADTEGSCAWLSSAAWMVRTMGRLRLFKAFGRLSRMTAADPTRSRMTSSLVPVNCCCTPASRYLPIVGKNHLGRLLGDNDSRRIGIAGNDIRHDRGIGDAQPPEGPQLQPRIDDAFGIRSHARRADRMEARRADIARRLFQIGLRSAERRVGKQ